MLKGSTKRFQVVLTQTHEVLAMLKGGGAAKCFHPLKGRGGGG